MTFAAAPQQKHFFFLIPWLNHDIPLVKLWIFPLHLHDIHMIFGQIQWYSNHISMDIPSIFQVPGRHHLKNRATGGRSSCPRANRFAIPWTGHQGHHGHPGVSTGCYGKVGILIFTSLQVTSSVIFFIFEMGENLWGKSWTIPLLMVNHKFSTNRRHLMRMLHLQTHPYY